MSDEPEYLQPGFDPADLRVAELRGLLLEHDVNYPSTAKKAQLVDLFNQHIASRAPQIAAQRNRVRASAEGIVSVDKQGNALVPPSRKTPRRAKSRSAAITDDGSPVRDRAEESVIAGTEEPEEPETPRTVRRSRRSSSRREDLVPATPNISLKGQDTEDSAEKSPFSTENVFQRGSPTKPIPAVDKDSRRKRSRSRKDERSSSRTGRRVTDFLPDATSTSQSKIQGNRRRSEMPVLRPSTASVSPERTPIKVESADDDDDLVPAGEEFTPEETQELEEEEHQAHLVRSRRIQRSSSPPTSMLWFVAATLLCAYGVWWRKEKIEIGYCGVGKTAPNGLRLTSYDEPTWADWLKPQCEPCPPNAICKSNFRAQCRPDYVLEHSVLSLGGLIPIPPTCEPDSEKLRRIAILSEEAIKIVRRRAAGVDCGEVEPIKKSSGGAEQVIKSREDGPIAQGKGMDESELKQQLYDMKAPKLSDAQFDELFKAALEDAASQEEMEALVDSKTGDLILASSSLAAIPLTCSIRLSIIRILTNYRLELISAIAAFIAILQINYKVQQRRKNSALVTKYVHLVLRLLSKKAELAYKSGRDEDAAVAVVQMRDQVMQHEFNPARRKMVWEDVQKVVECNSNVRATSNEVRGEVLRCWTWIGAVGGWDVTSSSGGMGVKEDQWEREIEFPRIVA